VLPAHYWADYKRPIGAGGEAINWVAEHVTLPH
jgi:hypothetical protein